MKIATLMHHTPLTVCAHAVRTLEDGNWHLVVLNRRWLGIGTTELNIDGRRYEPVDNSLISFDGQRIQFGEVTYYDLPQKLNEWSMSYLIKVEGPNKFQVKGIHVRQGLRTHFLRTSQENHNV